MKILYLGDIMGRPGRETVMQQLPAMLKETRADVVIAQGENLSGGKGLKVSHVEELLQAGVSFFTGGNWSWARDEIIPWLDDATKPVIRPANYPEGTPGRGWKELVTPGGKIQVISLLGQIVGFYQPETLNPLQVIDQILEETKDEPYLARVVNFHGDYSSEKLVIGQYLDGRVSAVIGDHWHVPTADAQVLPGGTAHITDVGMIGSRASCLGVKTDVIIQRWHSGHPSRNELEMEGERWLCAVLVETELDSIKARKITQLIRSGL